MKSCDSCHEVVVHRDHVKTKDGIELWCGLCVELGTNECPICEYFVGYGAGYEIELPDTHEDVTVCCGDIVKWAVRQILDPVETLVNELQDQCVGVVS